MNQIPLEQHDVEIQKNLQSWNSKPILQKIYNDFYAQIAKYIRYDLNGKILEIGSGIGNLKTLVKDCICSDIFPNPWINQIENAYNLSFSDNSLSNIILFDVFHHIEFPGNVLQEFSRVLVPGGRAIIFDPAISLLGFVVYGLFHHEPAGYREKIKWWAPDNFFYENLYYYAAQGNASRIFINKKYSNYLLNWTIIKAKRFASISYVASGGYNGPQLYPEILLPFMKIIDKICNYFPILFATRLLVVLEKKYSV